MNFTPAAISALSVEQGRLEVYDKTERGLGIRVSAKGSKTFFYRYHFAGKSRRFTIGGFPGVSLKQARQQARALKVKIAQGEDPQLQKMEARQIPELLLVSDLI